MKKLMIISIILIIILFGINIYFYSSLPEKIITHWNSIGEPNGAMNKFWGIFLIPVVVLGIFLLFYFIPKIDPLKRNIEKFQNYYESFILVMVIFFCYIDILSLLWNIGYKFNLSLMMTPGAGILFIYIGFILKNIKQNWFIGIRTPWTLSSEKVWDKTHKLGSKLFIISGIIILLGMFFIKYLIWFILIPTISSALISTIYSYLEFRKEKKEKLLR